MALCVLLVVFHCVSPVGRDDSLFTFWIMEIVFLEVKIDESLDTCLIPGSPVEDASYPIMSDGSLC